MNNLERCRFNVEYTRMRSDGAWFFSKDNNEIDRWEKAYEEAKKEYKIAELDALIEEKKKCLI